MRIRNIRLRSLASVARSSALATAIICFAASHAPAFDIVFVNPGKQGDKFWDMTTAAMRSAADDLGHSVETLYSDRDRYQMRALAEQVIARADPPDYLILVNEEQFAAALLPEANAAGIKTLLLLNGPIGADQETLGAPGGQLKHWLGSLTPDNTGAGRRMIERGLAEARRLGLKNADGAVTTLALGGDKTTPASIDRQRGALRALANAEDASLERIFFARWSRSEARAQTERYLKSRNAAPALIWAANDEMALGAIEALEAEGYRPGRDTVVVGLNWSSEALGRVRDGEMLLSDGGHFLGGAWAVVALHDFHEDPSTDVGAFQARMRFSMAAIDARIVADLGEKTPLSALRMTDFTQFSEAHMGDRALPLSLEAYLTLICGDPIETADTPSEVR